MSVLLWITLHLWGMSHLFRSVFTVNRPGRAGSQLILNSIRLDPPPIAPVSLCSDTCYQLDMRSEANLKILCIVILKWDPLGEVVQTRLPRFTAEGMRRGGDVTVRDDTTLHPYCLRNTLLVAKYKILLFFTRNACVVRLLIKSRYLGHVQTSRLVCNTYTGVGSLTSPPRFSNWFTLEASNIDITDI